MNPDIVTVSATAAGMVAPTVVIITEVDVGALQIALKLGMLLWPAATVGVADAKKELGYVSVMMPPGPRDVTGTKRIVTGTLLLAATRSDACK